MVCVDESSVFREQALKSGGDSETATPVPMPNTEVKRLSAESSWGFSPCEDRTLPGYILED